MAIPAMALLQQHDARWDILIEPAAWRRAAIEARGPYLTLPMGWEHTAPSAEATEARRHSELGAQSGHKNQPACPFTCFVD